MQIFYSWQSDLNHENHLGFIRQALSEAIQRAGLQLDLEEAERPKLDEAGKDRKGAENIVKVIHDKITRCAIFVADVTPITTSPRGKILPNPNVIYELGWATAKTGYERVILVMNLAEGHQIKDMPFDLVQRPIITYTLKTGATDKQRAKALERLVDALEGAITANLTDYIAQTEAAAGIKGRASLEGDVSVWTDKPLIIRGQSGRTSSLHIPKIGRAWLRIVPHKWQDAPPSPDVFLKLADPLRPEPIPPGATSGDYSRTSDGAVRYWMTEASNRDAPTSTDLAHYFDDNGELWMLAGVYWKAPKGTGFDLSNTLKAWARTLAAGHAFLDQFGASKLRLVSAGVTGLLHAHLPTKGYSTVQSVKPSVELQRQSSEWDASAQLMFVHEGLNQLRAAFCMPPATMEDTKAMLSTP